MQLIRSALLALLLLLAARGPAATVRVLSQDNNGLRFRVELDDLTVHADSAAGRIATPGLLVEGLVSSRSL